MMALTVADIPDDVHRRVVLLLPVGVVLPTELHRFLVRAIGGQLGIAANDRYSIEVVGVEEVEDDVFVLLAADLDLLGVAVQALCVVVHLRASLIADWFGADLQERVHNGGEEELQS